MQDQPFMLPVKNKRILVVGQHELTGRQFVHMLQQETANQAILATSFPEAQHILQRLPCDLVVLIDDIIPDEDLEKLDGLPEDGEPPTLLSVPLFSQSTHSWNKGDGRSSAKAVQLLLAVRGRDGLAPLKQAPGRDI